MCSIERLEQLDQERSCCLEIHFDSQLNLSGLIRSVVDGAEVWIVNVGVGGSEDRMVEGVLCFEAKLKIHTFAKAFHGEIFFHG